MKETKELKTNKGITLIALVITIIVMMILVGVTISMSINGGLFTKAGEATGQMNNALKAEQLLADGKIVVNNVLYDSLDAYLEREKDTVEPTVCPCCNGTGDIDVYHITCPECSYVVDLSDYENSSGNWFSWAWQNGYFVETIGDYECSDCGHVWQSPHTESCPEPECESSNIELIIWNGDLTWPCGHVETSISEEMYYDEETFVKEPGPCEYCQEIE